MLWATILVISHVPRYPQVPVDECLSPTCIRGILRAFCTAVTSALPATHRSNHESPAQSYPACC